MELIEREAAYGAYCEDAGCKKVYGVDCDGVNCLGVKSIASVPTIDAAPVVHGRWVTRNDSPYGQKRKYCSACGKHSGLIKERPYCPNCGARMDGGEGHE